VQITWNLNALEDFFSGNWDIQAFRIVQEALTNALKHASASLIRVETRRLEGNLEIRIEDNGKGFKDAEKGEGLGLSILRERVRGLGGTHFLGVGQPRNFGAYFAARAGCIFR
jgi:signal transduction histidine kinase